MDMLTRKLILRNSDGSLFKFNANKEVSNLPQVSVGDEVVVVYAEALALRMAMPVEVRNETSRGRAITLPGDKPGSIEVVETTVTARIKGIDKTIKTVTLKLADGNPRVVKVQDSANLDKLVKTSKLGWLSR